MVRKILKEVRFMSWEQVYEQWIDSDKLDVKMRKELQDLGKEKKKKKDAFYKQLEFGTAGMRGVLGPVSIE